MRDTPHFAREEALSYWGMIHGIMLLLGTVAAALGFAAGIMYLLQSYRLKHKLLPRPGFRLPSLEWLQHFNRRSLLLSTGLLALGLLAGLVLNIIRHSSQRGEHFLDRSGGAFVVGPVCLAGRRDAFRVALQAGSRRTQSRLHHAGQLRLPGTGA